MAEEQQQKGNSADWLHVIMLLLLVVFAAPLHAADLIRSVHRADIIIILDDLGNRQTDFNALGLPSEVVFSILPDTPLATTLSHRASKQGRDVMLHLPMEAVANNQLLGPRAIRADMYPSHISQTLDAALASVPTAMGINNHMGSLVTRDRTILQPLMQAVRQRDLFFVDSRTIAGSLAQQVAVENGVPSAHRHVFLDHEQTLSFMNAQFARLIDIARRRGVAIGIAHPHDSTLAFLARHLPQLDAYGVQLMSMSEYFEARYEHRAPARNTSRQIAAPH
ncbi:divergent polysaccharide deacetylase family protein [Alteromonas sp. CYL-A6]|uniref:divergent polysaccharide deacetylase family protein n=1 Tax=Alteromonas nitratireducens TaxID=3390813 RepID=UPI0034BDCF9B